MSDEDEVRALIQRECEKMADDHRKLMRGLVWQAPIIAGLLALAWWFK